MDDIQKRQFEASLKAIANRVGVPITGKSPDEQVAAIANATGVDLETVKSTTFRGADTPQSKEAEADEFIQVGSEAERVGEELKSPEGRKNAWNMFKDAVQKGAAVVMGSVDLLPVGNDMKDALRRFGNDTLRKVAGGAFTGIEEGEHFYGRVRDLHKSVASRLPTKEELFDEAVGLLMTVRRGDGKFDTAELHGMTKRILDQRKLLGDDFATHQEDIVNKALELGQDAEVKSFVDAEAKKLNALGEVMKEEGIIRDMKESYFPNLVRMEQEKLNPVERVLFKQGYSTGDFSKLKAYKSGVHASLDGFMPVSFRASDMMRIYHERVGKRLALVDLREKIKANADTWMVTTNSDVQERAFYVSKEGREELRSRDGRYYVNLGVLQPRLNGYYAHPDIYRGWGEKVLNHVKKEGLVGSYFKLSERVKGLHFGFDFFHVATLIKKGVELGGAFKFFANPVSVVRTGLDAMKAYDPHLLKLAEHGCTFHREQSEQSIYNVFNYDSHTGQKKLNLWNQLLTFGGLSSMATRGIFHVFQPGMKAGMAKMIVETDRFKRWVDEGGEDYAYQNLATLLNNHFGGQNLTALGRSAFAQSFFQAALLAPDFQESMWRRNFGIFHPDDNLREVYRASIGIQAAMVAITVPLLQGIIDELRGKKRTARDWMHNSVGHWMDIEIGESDKGRKIYVNPFGAEKETFRPILNGFNGLYGAFMGTDLTGTESEFKDSNFFAKIAKPIMTDLAQELNNKGNPLAREVIAAMNRSGFKSKDMTMYDMPWMPISIQPAVYSALGGFQEKPEDRAKWLASSIITSGIGSPITEGRKKPKKEGKEIFPGKFSLGKSKDKKKAKLEAFR